ncbi:MAG: YaiI/YqxD family protein [Magnetococcales bacterium]|nr:YaiI/YqxD family protein [Magnetococcales bacterium]
MEKRKPEIYVDADACPVKGETLRVAERHRLIVHMVSNRWIHLPENPLIRRQVTPGGLDRVDDWIAEHIAEGDVAITADIPLASRCLEKKARVLGPTGRTLDAESIGMALALRDLNAYLRETGELKGSGVAFAKKDRSRFLSALEEAVQAILRQG